MTGHTPWPPSDVSVLPAESTRSPWSRPQLPLAPTRQQTNFPRDPLSKRCDPRATRQAKVDGSRMGAEKAEI